MTNSNLHNISIGHCNIQGGFKGISKSTQVQQLIKNNHLDILSVNETNLNDTIDTNSLNIPPNYEFKRVDRGSGSRGGCGMIISNTCAYTPIPMKTDVDNIEAYWIKISNINIYICGFYRSRGYCKLENFIEYFTQCMKKLKGKKVIWIGDINIDQNKINDSEYKNFDFTLKSFGMKQTIQNYTRTVKRGNKITRSTIDVILTNCYSDFNSSVVLPESIGDHNAIKCELNFKVEKPPKYEKFSFHNYSNDNINAFRKHLQNLNFNPILECSDVNIAVSNLNA